MAAATLRIGVIGLGMGRTHALAALDSDGVELAAIAEPNAARVEQLAEIAEQRFGKRAAARVRALPVYPDYQSMVRAGGIDAVANALPTPLHASSSRHLLNAGMHVLCEKPPSCTAAEIKKVASLARERGLTYMFVRQQRFEAGKQVGRQMIADGDCGRVYHAEARWIRSCGIPFRGGWGVNKDAGGGVLLDLGIHKLDDAWYVMGCPQPVEAFCAMHCAFSELGTAQKLDMPYDADDAAVGMLRFADGASLSFAVSFALNTDGHPHAELADGNTEWQELRVHGTRRGIDIGAKRLIERKPGALRVRSRALPTGRFRGREGFRGMYENFARAVRSGDDSENPPEQAVRLMQMLEALRKSAERGRSVSIKPFAPAPRRRRTNRREA